MQVLMPWLLIWYLVKNGAFKCFYAWRPFIGASFSLQRCLLSSCIGYGFTTVVSVQSGLLLFFTPDLIKCQLYTKLLIRIVFLSGFMQLYGRLKLKIDYYS